MCRVLELQYDRPIQKYLLASESLLWVGRPPQGVLFRNTDWYFVPFSVAWCAIAMKWEWRAVHFSPCPSLIGLPFVALGVYMTVARFFFDAYQRRRTWYGVTDRRALILYVGRSVCLNGIDLSESPKVRLEERPDGSGTITFKPRHLTRIGKTAPVAAAFLTTDARATSHSSGFPPLAR
jgi:hypothetical protein